MRQGCPMLRKKIIVVAMFALARPALAGPPYVSDDPEPTDYKHFEIYTFSNGTATRGDIGGAAGGNEPNPAARRKRSPPKICVDIFPLARALISRNGTYGMSAPGERPTPP